MPALAVQHRFLPNLLHSKSDPENRFPHRSKMVAPDPSTMHSFLAYRQNECLVIGASYYGDMSIDDVSVIEETGCLDPIIATSTQTNTQANFSWTAVGSGLNYNIAIKPLGQTLTASDIGFTTLNQVQYALGGLIPNTTYTFYLRDSCGVGNVSNWVTSSFITPCVSAGIPYLEDFNVWAPSCWDLDDGTELVAQDASGKYLEGNFWSWSSGKTGYALSPSFDITQPTRVSFEWAHLHNTSYPDDQVVLLIREVGASSWDTLVNLKGSTFTSPNAMNYTPPADSNDFIIEDVDLVNSYIGKKVEFRLDMNSGWGPDVYIDNFIVETSGGCARPFSISNQVISSTEVLVSWSSTGPGSVYELEYDTTGFFQSLGTIVSTADTFYTITGLNATTGYEAYIMQRCGAVLSNSRMTAFMTVCDDFALPFTENFDVWPPICWTLDEGTQIVGQSVTGGHMEGNFWAWPGIENGVARSPRILMSGKANFSFDWAHLYSTTYPTDQLVLLMREVGSTSAWDTLVEFSGPTFTSPNAQNGVPPLASDFITENIALDSSYTGKLMEFRFDMNSGFGPDVYIDNVEITELCLDPNIPQISAINFVSAPRSYNVQFTTPSIGELMLLQVRESGSTAWKTPKSWTNATLTTHNFRADAFGTTNEVRIGMRTAGAWTYSCISTFDASCSPMTVSAIELVPPFCVGDSALLKGIYSGGFKAKTFLWNTGETSRFIYGQQGQSYMVYVTDQAGCTDSASILVSTVNALYTPDNFALAKPNAVTFVGSWTAPSLGTGASIVGYRMQYREAGVGASWNTTPLNTATSATIDFTGSCAPAANYEFTVFARVNVQGVVSNTLVSCKERKFYNGSGGCSSAKADGDASANDAGFYGITVYPNPTRSILNVSLQNEMSTLELLDMNGKLLFSQEFEGDSEVGIDMSNYAQGVYMLNIINSKGIFQERIVKN